MKAPYQVHDQILTFEEKREHLQFLLGGPASLTDDEISAIIEAIEYAITTIYMAPERKET